MPFIPLRSLRLLPTMLLVGIAMSACQGQPPRYTPPPAAAVEPAPVPAAALAPAEVKPAVAAAPKPKPKAKPAAKKVPPKPTPRTAATAARVDPSQLTPAQLAGTGTAPLPAAPKPKPAPKPAAKPPVKRVPPAASAKSTTDADKARPKLPSVSIVIPRPPTDAAARAPAPTAASAPPLEPTPAPKPDPDLAATAAKPVVLRLPPPTFKPIPTIDTPVLIAVGKRDWLAAKPAVATAPEVPPPTAAPIPAIAPELKAETPTHPEAKPEPSVTPPTAPSAVVAKAAPRKAAPKPKPAARKPPTPIDPLANPPLSEAERQALAAIPLPKLPNLVNREVAAARQAAAAAALQAGVDDAPEPASAFTPPTPDPAIEALLRRASERAGLGDRELARIEAIEQKLAIGEQAAAIEDLALLNADLDRAVRVYAVAKGENLRAVAARPENYGNAALWPLIWRANLEALPEPWQVQRDQKLIVPSFPPLSDVTDALRYAQEHQQDVVRPESR